jgi:DNA polymerase-3 subunit gamma/tau
MRVLARTWQMLLKGIPEVKEAGRPVAAAEMVLVRIAYAADLPAPEDLVRSLVPSDGAPSRAATEPPARTAIEPPQLRAAAMPGVSAKPEPQLRAVAMPAAQEASLARALNRFEDIVALAGEKRDLMMKSALERDVRPVRMEDGKLEIALEPGASKALANDLGRKLSLWTGRRWMVAVSTEQGAPTLKSQAERRLTELNRGVQTHPLVQAVMTRFPGAEITRVSPRQETDAAAMPLADDPLPSSEEPWQDDDSDGDDER